MPVYNLIRYEIGDHVKNSEMLQLFYRRLMETQRHNLEDIHNWFLGIKRDRLKLIGLKVQRPKCEDGSHYIDIVLMGKVSTFVVTKFISKNGHYEMSSSMVSDDSDDTDEDNDADDGPMVTIW